MNRPFPRSDAPASQSKNKGPSDSVKDVSAKLRFGEAKPAAELFDDYARQVAEALAATASKQNKPTQIRRFYDELVGWEERINGKQQEFEKHEAFIRMLNAKVAYAKGRELVDGDFEHWFRRCVEQTKSAEGLKHFRLHFEAVLGFLKGLRGRD